MNPFDLARSLHTQIVRLLGNFDIHDMPPEERGILTAIKRQAADIRLDIHDYGIAETKVQQDEAAREVRTHLKQLESDIIKAGSLGLFGAADVAHLSAIVQQLMADV